MSTGQLLIICGTAIIVAIIFAGAAGNIAETLAGVEEDDPRTSGR